MKHEWYEIQATIFERPPGNVFLQHQKVEMVVGPHTRPAGFQGGAMIESKELAETFAEAIKPIFKKRYGESTELSVVLCSGFLREKDLAKIKSHSDIIKARLATNNFVPNKRVGV
jgi:hypothetical protein